MESKGVQGCGSSSESGVPPYEYYVETFIEFRRGPVSQGEISSAIVIYAYRYDKPDALDAESSALQATQFEGILTASFGCVVLDLQCSRIMCHHFTVLVLEENLCKITHLHISAH
ncbi:hypothetical protein PCH_Pc13g14280 [Penicillium rubens Wisconsin 54-1255]|uniref:Uncharacterized protein n=1 Tax=Penicillium rubens (strain ATCC 28089 / DSM 1075 / NRRL 1951 / Wisconsin 54-1255) TaxID=500485 RepID=B6H5C2_PENRW|nr:hypothetical protein PCH_Pc13g14280 [Penicillium rubens Wisconsin 54-1255]